MKKATREEILECLREILTGREEVAAAYLYGSAARDKATSLSDVDVAILFARQVNQQAKRDIAAELAGRLVRAMLGRAFDIRDAESLPLVVRGRVVSEGILAGSNDHVRRVAFEVDTRQRYFDFLPFHQRDVSEGLRGLRRKHLGG